MKKNRFWGPKKGFLGKIPYTLWRTVEVDKWIKALRLPRAPAQCVSSPGAGFNPPEFGSPCGLPVSCCLDTSVVRSRNSKRLFAPPRVYVCICMDSAVPARSSLTQDLYGSGRHESGICTSLSLGPWRARRLDSTVWTLVFG